MDFVFAPEVAAAVVELEAVAGASQGFPVSMAPAPDDDEEVAHAEIA